MARWAAKFSKGGAHAAPAKTEGVMEDKMQHRFVAAGIVCLMVAGPAFAQEMQGDQPQGVPQQATTSEQSQSKSDSSVGGAADTRSQYGTTGTQNCTLRPTCDIFFGS